MYVMARRDHGNFTFPEEATCTSLPLHPSRRLAKWSSECWASFLRNNKAVVNVSGRNLKPPYAQIRRHVFYLLSCSPLKALTYACLNDQTTKQCCNWGVSHSTSTLPLPATAPITSFMNAFPFTTTSRESPRMQERNRQTHKDDGGLQQSRWQMTTDFSNRIGHIPPHRQFTSETYHQALLWFIHRKGAVENSKLCLREISAFFTNSSLLCFQRILLI